MNAIILKIHLSVGDFEFEVLAKLLQITPVLFLKEFFEGKKISKWEREKDNENDSTIKRFNLQLTFN